MWPCPPVWMLALGPQTPIGSCGELASFLTLASHHLCLLQMCIRRWSQSMSSLRWGSRTVVMPVHDDVEMGDCIAEKVTWWLICQSERQIQQQWEKELQEREKRLRQEMETVGRVASLEERLHAHVQDVEEVRHTQALTLRYRSLAQNASMHSAMMMEFL